MGRFQALDAIMKNAAKLAEKEAIPASKYGAVTVIPSAADKVAEKAAANGYKSIPVGLTQHAPIPALGDLPVINNTQPADALNFIKNNEKASALYDKATEEQKQGMVQKVLEKMQSTAPKVAGFAAMKQESGIGDPYAELAGNLKRGYNWYKENVQQPIADKITQQTDPAQQLIARGIVQQAPGLKEAGRAIFDPVNLAGDVGAAAQLGAEMLPEETEAQKLARKKYESEQ